MCQTCMAKPTKQPQTAVSSRLQSRWRGRRQRLNLVTSYCYEALSRQPARLGLLVFFPVFFPVWNAGLARAGCRICPGMIKDGFQPCLVNFFSSFRCYNPSPFSQLSRYDHWSLVGVAQERVSSVIRQWF